MMVRHRALGLTIATLIIISLACNAFAGNREPSLAPAPTAIAGAPAEMVATVTLPAISSTSTATVSILVDLNVRSGPGVQYDRIGFLLKGESAPITGVHSETGWWKIECPALIAGSQCWIAGGDQYSRAEGSETVPEVEAPPTPTPVPPEIGENRGVLAFVDDGHLYAAQLDLAQNPLLLATDPVLLGDAANVQVMSISPDGRRVAYVSGNSEANSLNVVNIDGQDQRVLISSTELPLGVVENATGFRRLVHQVQWLMDSSALAFNTEVINSTGSNVGGWEDLWTVNLNGELSEILRSGTGGGAFIIAPSGKVLISRPDKIIRANLDGSNVQTIIEFEAINTASEYVYYPLPQLTAMGGIYVAIPDAQPFEPGARTVLWQIPDGGPAGQLGSVEGANLSDPVLWSHDGGQLAYLQNSADQDAPQASRLMIADGKGIDAEPYAGGEMLILHAWGPGSTNFLYSGIGFFAVGQQSAPTVQTMFSPGQTVGDAQWLTDQAFIVSVGYPESNTWELHSASNSGDRLVLTTLHGFDALFDTWRP
jgi:hypothetical protein